MMIVCFPCIQYATMGATAKVLSTFLCLITTCIALNYIVPENLRVAWYGIVEPHENPCICETRVDLRFARSIILKTEFPDNSRLKCYMGCTAGRMNFLDMATGEWSAKEINRQMAGVTYKLASNCINQTAGGSDWCQRSIDIFMCIVYGVTVPVIDY
ncbi:uncharacterized protein LOC116173033 [Photinus pyralis]|uniref:uncharacterized protein LOC116173033 n=1 Tax=Photinus pyralis TaxID=7054 RepID=UPI0012670D9F|nr:uncharacterized protein LOC116173033 [Photinus pyralis]